MNSLAQWLRSEINARGLTQAAASVDAGVSSATVSQILAQDHIPTIEILFRLADYFGTPREKILRIAARMPLGDDDPRDEDETLIEQLVEEFRQVPDEWKMEAVRQVQMFRRLAEMPTVRFIGEENGDDDPDQTPST